MYLLRGGGEGGGGEDQCFHKALEEPCVCLRHFRVFVKALVFPEGYNGSHVPLGRVVAYLHRMHV